MLHLEAFAFTVALFVGLNQLQNAASIKTEEQIVSEIKSTANDIKSECRQEIIKSGCDSEKREVDLSNTKLTVCMAMKPYRLCQNLNCFYKSAFLKELLNYPELIETCRQVVNMTLLEPGVENVISEVNAIRDECNFEPDKTCILKNSSYHFTYTKVADICLTRRYYGVCLKLLCRSPSPALSLKIDKAKYGLSCGPTQLQNAVNKTEGIKIIAEAIRRECVNHLLNDSCDGPKRAVDNSESLSTICQAMNTYRVCQNLNCFNTSALLKELLNYPELIETCRQVANMALEPGVENVISEVNAMKDECNFEPDKTCFKKAGTYHFTSTKIADICQARQDYGDCLQLLCLSPSTALSIKINNAKYGFSCGTTQRQNANSNKPEGTTQRQNADSNKPEGPTQRQNADSNKPEGTTQRQNPDSNNLEGIKAIAEAMSRECYYHLLNDSCDWSKKAVDNSGSLSTICQAMKTYRVCQNLNCYKKSALLKELLNKKELFETCGQVLNIPLEPGVENVISEVNAMKEQCNFEPNKTCVRIAGTYHFTSTKIADICQARKYYGECLQLLCLSPSFDLRDRFDKARKGLSCDGCGLSTSGVVMVIVAVVNYLCSL